MELYAILASAAAVIFSFEVWVRRDKPTDLVKQEWSDAADWLKLQFEDGGRSAGPTLKGTVDGARVTVSTYVAGHRQYLRTRVQATPEHDSLADITIEQDWRSERALQVPKDFLVGDTTFDNQVLVLGHEADCLALLDHKTRNLVVRAISEYGCRVRKGQVLAEVHQEISSALQLTRFVRQISQLTMRLSPVDDIPQRLHDNAVNDDEPGVRVRNLEYLTENYPESSEAQSAALVGLEDDEAQVRGVAASYLGQEAFARLRRMIHSDDPGRAQWALRYVTWNFAPSQVIPVLRNTMRNGPKALVPIAVRSLVRLGEHPPTAPIIESLDEYAEARRTHKSLPLAKDTVEAYVEALGQIAESEAEPVLLKLLAVSGKSLSIQVLRVLSRLGTVRAVEPLLLLCRTSKTDPDLREQALKTVDRIQGKLGEVGAGRLSVADDKGEKGRLTVSRDAGQLQVVEASDPEEEDENIEIEGESEPDEG